MFSTIGQLAFNGLTIGLIYVILAAGLVLILSVTEIFFVAYGQFYMVGAYVAWYAVRSIGLPYFLALLVGVLATAVLGILSYLLILQRIQHSESRFLLTVTAALGLSLIVGQCGLLIFPTTPQSIPTVFHGSFTVGGIIFGVDKLALISMGVIVSVILFWVYETQGIGRAMRAVSLMPEVAALQGINPNRIYLLTMGIGTALAGLAGGILAPSYNINPSMGNNVIASILLMTMLGGMDSLLGAVAGGLVVGLILSFGQYYLGGIVQVYLFLIIGIIIFFRPNGLLGHRTDIGV
jgi:branched-chain amino acid transport system permease protein